MVQDVHPPLVGGIAMLAVVLLLVST